MIVKCRVTPIKLSTFCRCSNEQLNSTHNHFIHIRRNGKTNTFNLGWLCKSSSYSMPKLSYGSRTSFVCVCVCILHFKVESGFIQISHCLRQLEALIVLTEVVAFCLMT